MKSVLPNTDQAPWRTAALVAIAALALCGVARAEDNGGSAGDCFGACPALILVPRLSARELSTSGASVDHLTSSGDLGVEAAVRLWRRKNALSVFFLFSR